MIRVHYLAHSGWLIELEDQLILFDYWKGALPDIIHNASKPLLILVSHAHSDHFNREIFTLASKRGNTHLVLSSDVPKPPKELCETIILSEGTSATLGDVRIKAFGSTDAGISFLLYFPTFSLFHAGDYNLWHWPLESTEEEIREAEQEFYRILNDLTKEHVDIAFFPVDSRQQEDYDRGAREFCNIIKPHLFFPMHFGEDWQAQEPFRIWAEKEMPLMKVFMVMPNSRAFEINEDY